MLWLFVGPTGVNVLDLFCSGIQFYLLLSPYLLLYLLVISRFGCSGRWCIAKLGVVYSNKISMYLDRRETGLSPRVKYFTDRSKAVLLLWIFYVFCVLCLLWLCARLFTCALWSPAGTGRPLGFRLWCQTVSLSLSHWYPGSGVVLDCIDSWSLHPYLLRMRAKQFFVF